MKKGTLIVFLLALSLGAYLYFYELPRGKGRDAPKDETTAAFSFAADDVAGLAIHRGGQTIRLEKRDTEWVITQPVETRADQNAASSIANNVASARMDRTLAAKPEQLATYGLDKPVVALEVQLKSGTAHRLRLGNRDFAGTAVYALLDDRTDVALLTGPLLASVDKPLDELRDRSVLAFSTWEVNGIELATRAGRFRLARQESDWKLVEPRELPADEAAVRDLLDAVASARIAEVVAETADRAARYGLDRPQVELRVHTEKGDERTLLLGRKQTSTSPAKKPAPAKPERYFARDTSRSMVFAVDAEVAKSLDVNLFKLRDKRIVRFDRENLSRIELRNVAGTLVAEKNAEGKWIIQQPAEQKDKELQAWKVIDAMEDARAEEIFDSPPASVTARLAKPTIELTLTLKEGPPIHISFSSVSGSSAYARSGAAVTVFRVGKSLFDQLNANPADLATSP